MSGIDLKQRIIESILDDEPKYPDSEHPEKWGAASDKIDRMSNTELLDAVSDALNFQLGLRPRRG